MAYKVGYASTTYELLKEINTLMTNNGWAVLDSATTTFNGQTVPCYYVWQGSGDGNDKIYLQMKIYDDDHKKIALDSLAGFDKNLYYFEQPGSIQQWLKATDEDKVDQPAFVLPVNELFYFWIFVDSYRLIVVTRMSIEYHSMYMGFIEPIASERQYSYPMYVCGNTALKTGLNWNDCEHPSFVFPYQGSGMLRRIDGTWREFESRATMPEPNQQGSVFPYTAQNKQLLPNYKGKSDSSVAQDNFLLLPIIMRTENPVDMSGLLRDCYWISGTRDLSAEQTFVCNDTTYIVFDTKQYRNSNSYFCITMK